MVRRDDRRPDRPERAVPEDRADVPSGTIVVSTNERRLYLVLGQGRALAYPVGVGRAGRQWAGRSMIDSHIADGDYVVIRKKDAASNGERVVAVVDGEYTLKKFHRRHNQIELRPENGAMSPIVVEPGRDIRIEGVLVGVVRKC